MYPGGYKPQDQKLLIEVYPNEPGADDWPRRGWAQGSGTPSALELGTRVGIPTTSAIMTSEVAATPMDNALREVQEETSMSTRSMMIQYQEERAVESGVLVDLPPSLVNSTSEVVPPAMDTATVTGIATVSTFASITTCVTAPTENTTDDEEYVRLHSQNHGLRATPPFFQGR